MCVCVCLFWLKLNKGKNIIKIDFFTYYSDLFEDCWT